MVNIILPDIVFTVLRVALVVVILVAIISLLLGINHLSHNDDTISEEETSNFREEVKEKQEVISNRSVFHKFLARESRVGKR